MQSLRHAPHRLGPPDWPGRRTSNAVVSLRGDAFPAVVSLLLVLAGDIELNPGMNCYTCRKPIRRGMDYLQCQANSCTNGSHKQLRCSGFHRSQLTNSWRCPPHGGPGPPRRAPTTSTICDSSQQPIRAGIRPLTCATPGCPRLVHSARRCSGLSGRQGRWLCQQHHQPNHLPETVAGRPIAHSPHRLRKKLLPCNSRWNGPPPTTPSTHSQSATTVSRYSRKVSVGLQWPISKAPS